MQASGERRLPRAGGPAPAFLDPRPDRFRVGPGRPAQTRCLTRERLVRLALPRAFEDPGHFGQEVSPAARERPELGHRGGFLVAAQVPPLRPAARLAVKLGDEQPVRLRALIDHAF